LGAEDPLEALTTLFPAFEGDYVFSLVASLCYTQHGGSGFTFTRGDVMEMDLNEAEYYFEWLRDMRERESAAIRKASRGRSR
jgi:hypothetical protein